MSTFQYTQPTEEQKALMQTFLDRIIRASVEDPTLGNEKS